MSASLLSPAAIHAGRLYRVTEQLDGCHRLHADYPLLPGDVLAACPDNTRTELTGLAICGFVLNPEQQSQLELLPEGSEVRL